jgi:hypothetical protein
MCIRDSSKRLLRSNREKNSSAKLSASCSRQPKTLSQPYKVVATNWQVFSKLWQKDKILLNRKMIDRKIYNLKMLVCLLRVNIIESKKVKNFNQNQSSNKSLNKK